MKSAVITAVVHDIIRGKHGSYAVAGPLPEKPWPEEIHGSVTFFLRPPVWKERDLPERGMKVVLWRLRMKKAGWRAFRARFLGVDNDNITRL